MKVANSKKLKKGSVQRKYMLLGICFLLPALLFYAAFMAYPLYRTFYLSFTNWGGFGATKLEGIDNYVKMFSDKMFWRALGNSIYFAVFSSLFSVLIGVLLAWLILYQRRFEGQVYRSILFSPSMIAPTITGLLFLFIFTEDIGLLNNLFKAIGLTGLVNDWLTDIVTVKPVIVIITVWRQFGLVMVLCYAGLQGISNDMIECARLDGAGEGKIFTKVLLPLIKPQIELSMMFTMLGGLKIYDSVMSLTAGGPARQTVVLPMWIVENAYTYSKFGYASAMCVAFVVVVLCFNIILRRIFREKD